jgi:membrane associated rhomboid family serine protease
VTPWVGRLILLNVAMLVASLGAPGLMQNLALVPALALVRPWTLFTYMFLHAGFDHLLFNMLSLYFFGPLLESRLGSRSFIRLYFVSGLVGALLSVIRPVWPLVPIVGASGAVFGVMLGFARYWPRQRIYVWGLVGIEARWFVLIMTALSLLGARTGAGNIAHLAHLGGFLGGWLYLKWMEHRSPAAEWRRRVVPEAVRRTSLQDVERWKTIRLEALHPVNREEIERVMAKLSAAGVHSLTPGERELLDRFSGR